MNGQEETYSPNIFGASFLENGKRSGKAQLRTAAHHFFPWLLWGGEEWIILLNSFTKAELSEGWFRVTKQFYRENDGKCWGQINASHLLAFVNDKKNLSKEDLASLSFAVLKNKDIFTDFLHFLPEDIRKVLTHLVWNAKASPGQLEKALGVPIVDFHQRVVSGMKLFKIEENYSYSYYSHSSTSIEVSLPVHIRHLIAEYLEKPEGYYITPLDAIDFPSNVHLFSAEQCIFEELPRLLAYHQQGRLKYSTRGKPNQANVKKLAKALSIQEFYPEKGIFPSRMNILAGILYGYSGNEAELKDVVKVLFREYFVWHYKNSDYQKTHAPLYIFNYLKGTGSLDVHHINGRFNLYLKELLQKIPPGKWITKTNYAKHLVYNAIPIFPFTYEGTRKLYVKTDRKFDPREPVDERNSQQLVNFPYINGLIFVLAALGMVEIAYRKVDMSGQFGKDWFSEFDGLTAFRITRLGAYVLGIESCYETTQDLVQNKFIFEKDTLMLRVEGDLELIDVILEQFLERTSSNRYTFNAALFLNDCQNADDIKEKIAAFQQVVETALPPLWDNQLQLLLANAEQLDDCHHFHVYHLDPQNKTLQRLFAQDPILKKLVLKAEQFHVLVPANNLGRFKSRLRELGYLS